MKVLAIYGSPRKNGNTAQMMEAALSVFPPEAEMHKIILSDLHFNACGPCRECKEKGYCVMNDDMQEVFKELQWAEIILIGTPAQFSDVSSDVKKFMERTWWMKGDLKNKI